MCSKKASACSNVLVQPFLKLVELYQYFYKSGGVNFYWPIVASFAPCTIML